MITGPFDIARLRDAYRARQLCLRSTSRAEALAPHRGLSRSRRLDHASSPKTP